MTLIDAVKHVQQGLRADGVSFLQQLAQQFAPFTEIHEDYAWGSCRDEDLLPLPHWA